MDRPHPALNHEPCTESNCKGYDFNEKTYKTHHVDGCDQKCGWYETEPDTVHAILVAGEVPVVQFDHDQPDRMLTVVNASDPELLPYVANSHVWSDGMGNPDRESGMPCCQVRKVGAMVQELFPNAEKRVPFWIDTLCCPKQPPEATGLAIKLMRRTYEEAEKVLVVEDYLMRHQSGEMTATEKVLRVYVSNWATRLWTLQEGFLAKSLLVRFRDRSESLLSLFLEIGHDPRDVELTDALFQFFLDFFPRKPVEGDATDDDPDFFRTLQGPGDHYINSLTHISRSVRFRQTS